jgi:hypothetical protein
MDRVDIQNRIARLFHDSLLPVIDKHLSLKSGPGRTHKIERLEIDLGTLHFSRLEQDLLGRIEEELQTKLALSEMESEPALTEHAGDTRAKGSDVDLITYFLQTGAFPWWALESTVTTLEQAFRNAQNSSPDQLRRVLTRLLHDETVLQRCVYTCSETMLDQITEVCLPGAAARLKNVKREVSTSLGAIWNGTRIRQLWSYCVIRSAIVHQAQTSVDIIPDIVRLFTHLAGLREYEAQLGESPEMQQQVEMEVVSDLIAQLSILSAALPILIAVISNEGLEEIVRHLRGIEEAIAKAAVKEAISQRSSRWKTTQQEVLALRKIIAAHSNRSGLSVEDIQSINTFSPEVLSKKSFTQSGESQNAGNINAAKQKQQEAVLGGIKRIKKQLSSLATELDAAAMREGKVSSRTRDHMQVRLKKLWRQPAKDIIRSPKLYNAFSDSDKLYVQNSGLVLLWPYLHRFFINLGLADDKTFVDDDAAERACLMLQYLAYGDAEDIFEAQLPLNKLICGLELYWPLNTDWAIDADEKEIADGLLDAVLQNAPLWKNLSHDGFRQAYMGREGILSTRDGHWLLQVKRETYDITLDRLPWTIQVVKLPWMKNLLFVEWQQS